MINYDFHDLSKRTDRELEQQITEGFTFGDYNSTENGMFLISRDAPTPSSKDIIESVPYMQGVYDFSMLENDRYFDNRKITYQVILFEKEYENRKLPEQELKRKLMPLGVQVLYDTHDYGYHWLGKCESIVVEDDADKNILTATIIFDCYPMAIVNSMEGEDIWDEVYFPRWVFQQTKYTVNGSERISLFNIGSTTIIPKLVLSSEFTIISADNTITLPKGEYENPEIILGVGENRLKLVGNGTVEFKFNREEMI